jgi:putative ABC transport system permease protein
MQAIHLDWVAGVPLPGRSVSAEQALAMDLTPRSVTAALVGLKSRAAVFAVQRRVAEYDQEPLMAILPGVVLDELWAVVGAAEQALRLMGVLVAVVSLAGLVAVVVTALEQRRREMAVLRSTGAGPPRVFLLLGLEGRMVGLCGAAAGTLLWMLMTLLAAPWVEATYGIGLSGAGLRVPELVLLGAVVLATTLASLLPGWRAYRLSLAEGLSPRSL